MQDNHDESIGEDRNSNSNKAAIVTKENPASGRRRLINESHAAGPEPRVAIATGRAVADRFGSSRFRRSEAPPSKQHYGPGGVIAADAYGQQFHYGDPNFGMAGPITDSGARVRRFDHSEGSQMHGIVSGIHDEDHLYPSSPVYDYSVSRCLRLGSLDHAKNRALTFLQHKKKFSRSVLCLLRSILANPYWHRLIRKGRMNATQPERCVRLFLSVSLLADTARATGGVAIGSQRGRSRADIDADCSCRQPFRRATHCQGWRNQAC